LKFTVLLLKVLGYYLLTFDFERMTFFLGTFWSVLTGGPFSMGKWLEFFRWIATHRAFRKYVTEVHGLPEGVHPSRPPFGSAPLPVEMAPEPEVVTLAETPA